MCSQHQRLTLSLAFLDGSSVFACQEFALCVSLCVLEASMQEINPIMLNSGLKALPPCRKYGKGTISSLQGCHVKKAKQGPLFSALPRCSLLPLDLFILPASSLFTSPALLFFHQHTHARTHTHSKAQVSGVF